MSNEKMDRKTLASESDKSLSRLGLGSELKELKYKADEGDLGAMDRVAELYEGMGKPETALVWKKKAARRRFLLALMRKI